MLEDRKEWYFADRGKQTFAGYEKETLFNQGEELFEGKLRNYPNAIDINVNRLYEIEPDKKVLNTRVIIAAVGGYSNVNRKRKIAARKSFGLRIGDLILYEGDNYIVDDWVNHERITDDFSTMEYCNEVMVCDFSTETETGKYDDFGRPINNITTIIENIPCVYKTNKIGSYDEAPINLPDTRAHVYIQYNENIKVNSEVHVGGRNYKVYGIDETLKHPTENYGILVLTLETPTVTN